jgi:DNA-binding NarL/FixJ family response regulator
VLSTYRNTPRAAGPDTAADVLTARELQVLTLIGQGMTNGEIAAELVLGEGTVKTHVSHVFAKLQFRDRAAAIVFAFDHRLVAPSGHQDR